MDAAAFKPGEVRGILVSQVGYDLEYPKRAVFRSGDPAWLDGADFELVDVYDGAAYLSGPVSYWGMKWSSHWRIADFSACRRPGSYRLEITREGLKIDESDVFKIGPNLLWDECIDAIAFGQFEERALRSRYGSGWKDCGSDWRECCSHALAIIGLCDLLQYGYDFLTINRQRKLADIICVGCDYIVKLMDAAQAVGLAPGSVAHELPRHLLVIPGELASASFALSYAGRLLFELRPTEAADYIRRAGAAFDRFIAMEPWDGGGYSAINRGLKPGAEPRGFMTRDLAMGMRAGLSLYAAGRTELRPHILGLLRRVLSRQIDGGAAEFGYWGHFREFDGLPHSEKANVHHHVGHDTGGVIAFDLMPLIEFRARFYDTPEASEAEAAIRRFIDGFALPACRSNPFMLMPQGVFDGQGLLDFCGPWHGTNVSYGYFAAQAIRLAEATGNKELLELATGNVQWICGLNAGVTGESMRGCTYWRETIPAGRAVAYSQIVGVGRRSVRAWTDIRGSVPNGFSTNPPFTLQVEPSRENDGPWLFTDEDWIPHAGGLISALVAMRAYASVPWNR